MRKIILAILIATPLFSLAQKIVEDKVDDFKPYRSVSTSWVALKATLGVPNLEVMGTKIVSTKDTSEKLLSLMFRFTLSYVASAMKGKEINLKLSDGSVITLINEMDGRITGAGDKTTVYARLDGPGVEKLLNSNIEKIRFALTSTTVDYEVKKNEDAVINILNLLK